MNLSEVVDGGLFKAAEDAPKLFEPSDQPLDDVASVVGFAIEIGMVDIIRLLSLFRNHRLDTFRSQLADDGCRAVGFVTRQGFRLDEVLQRLVVEFRHGPQLLEQLSLVRLPGAQLNAQRMALAVTDDVDFRGESSAGTAKGVVRGFLWIPFFSAPAGTPVGADNRAVNAPQAVAKSIVHAETLLESPEDPHQRSIGGPAVEMGV